MKHLVRTQIPAHAFLALIVTTSLAAQVSDTLVIRAEQAAIKTEGGPVEGGWNLWSDGRVGQTVKIPGRDLHDRHPRLGKPGGGCLARDGPAGR